MEYARLGSTDLRVSRVCLGTVFRSEMDEATCLRALETGLDFGINFVDCANVYREGYSETIVGKFLKGRREQLIVNTKVGSDLGGESGGLSRAAIVRAVEASLKRLKTDFVDSYLCHFPDPSVPAEETVRAMDDLVRQGKIRYPGCSNFETWRLFEALDVSRHGNMASFASNQVLYSLLDRRIEDELVPFCRERNVAITCFATTAIGLLSGRYRYGQPPPADTSWFRGPYNYRAAVSQQVDEVIAALLEIASARGKTPTQVAMAWCLGRPGVTAVITGADPPTAWGRIAGPAAGGSARKRQLSSNGYRKASVS